MDKALAIEENGAAFLMALGRTAGAEERDDSRIRWAIGNSPIDYHNCVVGYPVYRRLGFEEFCRIGLYEWRSG